MTTVNSRLRGLVASLALIAFLVGVPSTLVAIDAIPDLEAFSWSRLTAPDDGTLLLEVLSIVCWIAWAIFTCQLIMSVFAQLRGLRSPRLLGLAMPQLAADRLVAVAALLFIAAPSAVALVPEPSAAAIVAATPLPDSDTAVVADPVATRVPPASADRAPQANEELYTVKRGDSLWRIAEERLGDGARYVELVELNRDVLNGRPDFLLPGTVLKVPKVEAPASDAYVVQPGDTLSEIAQEELGEADDYPAIAEASRDTIQADGAQLTDPDHLRPGWKLTIPRQSSPTAPPIPDDVERHTPDDPEPPSDPEPPDLTATVAPSAPADESTAEHSDDTDGTVIPGWLLPGLAGAGSIFGGALWLVLRAQRRTQLRHRRPGRVFPSLPTDLLPAEKTTHATASVIAPRIEALDAALRSLMPPLPRILTVTMSTNEISVSLAKPTDLPRPWSGAGTAWRIAVDDVPKRPEDSFPPYPLLVSIGQATDGAFVFLNLEELRTVTVTGDLNRKAAFARHLAAELAVNPWSIVTTVDLLGLGADLSLFNLGRVRTHPEGDTDFIGELGHTLSPITEPSDPDDFHVAIIATANRPLSDLDELAAVINGIPGRSSAALVDLVGGGRVSGTHVYLTADGRLQVEGLGIDVTAARLSEEEARACALLLDLTLTNEVMQVPLSDTDDAVSDLAGALAPHLIEPRPEGQAGSESLLPLDAHAYTEAAATTVEDIETLAPKVAPDAQATVEASDPTLDEDLARWEAPGLVATKLTLLGPVGARTTGDTKATARRRPFYVELLAFLALHPDGVSSRSIAEAFAIRPERVRVDISQLRRWLGNDPRTGKSYLPHAEASHDPDSPALYKLDGVLCDLDLFRRLRTRGQSRGADGIEDLVTALGLVSGEPFTELRKEHWNWLLEGDRWDHLMTSAIVDVGHIVTAHALAAGDDDLALWAAQVSYAAAPYDEIAQLDVVQAEKAAGHDAKAKHHLNDKVFNRRDDEPPPIDLPQRTQQIVGEKNWASRGSRPRRTG
ncbi:LysM peptidoglycan-binding domain-containing protein [Nocardioides gilvus]|uniref:LysM peptidoglycan-binding domain-containing protein n=1 Tax=Nocardioides gilvus TaxID=1735589 RepID=UPI000D74F999|nr:LysM peptidoglycan-binding domain-containing protein [Nocardioides gilvus]